MINKSDYQSIGIKEFFTIFRWVLKLYLGLYPKWATLQIVTSILRGFRYAVDTYVVAEIINKAINIAQSENVQLSELYPLIGILILVNLAINGLGMINRYAIAHISMNSRIDLRKKLYYKIYSLGIQSLEDPETNNKIDRAERELFQLENFFQNSVGIIELTVSLITNLVLLVTFAPIVIVILGCVAIPRALADKKYRKLIWKHSYDNTEERRRSSLSAQQLMDPKALSEIYINNAFDFLDEKFTKFSKWYTKTGMTIRKKWFIAGYSYSFLSDLSAIAGYFVVFSRFIGGKSNVGNLIFQMRIIDLFNRDTARFVQMSNQIFEFSIRIKDTYELFQKESEFKNGNIKIEKMRAGPKIELKQLSFKYPKAEKFVLKNIDLTINSGEKVAIVGHNGAGKTTLVKLISRIYLPTQGSILINNTSLADINSEAWYQNLGVLFQEYNMYSQLSVKDNIVLGNPNEALEENRMAAAAQNADILDFVKEYPFKFDQILSEKYNHGIRPSTGQWQKIAIARFFYRNSSLVIFDEPTAAIDAVSEYKIFNEIYNFFLGKTVIIISHRFSTVRNADRILVMENGEIIEQGSHQELMDLDGYYAKSFRLQAEGYSN